jgi:uncharacterized protein DUF4062
MAEAIRLEKSILKALKTSAANEWLSLTTLTTLGNLVREVDSSAAPSSIPELVDALLYLTEQGLLSIRQRDHGTGPVPFDEKRANDEAYKSLFFGEGAFELKLTHKGRRTLGDEGYEAPKNATPFARQPSGGPNVDSALTDGKDRHKLPRTAIVLNVLIASPSDVSEEREIVTSAVHAWNAAHYPNTGIMLNPIRWETHSFPASGDRPQAIVNRQIVDEGDFLIGIFGNRVGTPTGEAQSGTIEEIERFRKAGKYVALYFSTADVPRDADRDQLTALEDYQRERRKDTLYSTFGRSEELRQLVSQHLPHIVSEVHKTLRSSHQLEGLEEELHSTEARAEHQLSRIKSGDTRIRNPQIKAEFLGEYPDDGPTLWLTADREISLSQLDYLDLHEAKVHSDKLELEGQDFRIPVDHAKLVKVNNLMRSNGRPFRMKFRAEITCNGRAITHVIPVIVEPSMKLIKGTMTWFMKIVGSTTGYAL